VKNILNHMKTSRARHITASAAFFLTLAGLTSAGCKVGGPGKADPQLAELVALRTKTKALEAENAELRQQVARGALSAGRSADEALAEPAAVGIEIDSYTGWIKDAPADKPTLRVFLTTRDGRGRTVQLTGTLTVEVRSAEGTVLASKTLKPIELRDAYRSGLMGPFYVVELPAARAAGLAVRASFADARTNLTLESSLSLDDEGVPSPNRAAAGSTR
jgi:hypothetical protein